MSHSLTHAPVAQIDLAALRHNLAQCRAHNPKQPVMPVIKANGYGHGAYEIGRELLAAGAEAVCVARLDEALALRAAGLRGTVVVLEGVYNAAELRLALDAELTLVLHSAGQVAALPDDMATAVADTVWLKLETGMHRLGVPISDATALADALRAKNWCREVGWFTHLACADEPGHPSTPQQINELLALADQYGGPVSVANSAANLRAIGDGWQRPGIALYGSSPLLSHTAAQLNLQPVMSLEAPLLSINTIARGDSVGYGATWTAERPSRIGVVAIGYGDGYPRHLSSRPDLPDAEVWVAGQRCPVVGRVSMDKVTIDLTDHPGSITAGEQVQLWGNQISLDAVAARAGTIGYELVSGVTERVRRCYSNRAG